MRRQRCWSITVCTKFSAPLFLTCGFFVLMFFYGKEGTAGIATDAKVAFIIEQRKVRERGCLCCLAPRWFGNRRKLK